MGFIKIKYDFHIHTCLSPCADDDMTPNNIINMAFLAGLDAIAVTDHNTCKNCAAVIEAAKRQYPQITVLAGMELTTSEEIHVLILFSRLENALRFGEFAESKLLKIKNNPDFFGNQILMDQNDVKTGEYPDLLINAADISINEIYKTAVSFGGTAIPAHIDKQQNSVTSNLGFFDDSWGFCMAEFLKNINARVIPDYVEKSGLLKYNYILNSDAHSLGEIGTADGILKVTANTAQKALEALSGGYTQ